MSNESAATMSASLDRDTRTLTEFGFRETSPKRSSLSISDGLGWIQQLFTAKANDEEDTRIQPFTSAPSADASSSALGKEYWMSDRNCRECYDCQQPFSFFRRRHHCRLCGQVFCGACSHQQIDGKRYGVNAPLRVCKHCHTLARKTEYTRQHNAAALAPQPQPQPQPSMAHPTAIITRDAILPLAAIQFDEVKEANGKAFVDVTKRRSLDAAAPQNDARDDETKASADDGDDVVIRDDPAAAVGDEYRDSDSDGEAVDVDDADILNILPDISSSSASSSNSDCEAEVDEDDINALIATNKHSAQTSPECTDVPSSDAASLVSVTPSTNKEDSAVVPSPTTMPSSAVCVVAVCLSVVEVRSRART